MSRKKKQKEDVNITEEGEKLSDKIVKETMEEIRASVNEMDKQEAASDITQSEVLYLNDEESAHTGKKKRGAKKKTAKIIGGIVGAAALVYLGISLFFINHFYYGTKINDVDFSGKTASDVQNYMKQQVSVYKLTLKEREGKTEQINGADVELTYKDGGEIEKALKKQNPFLWISAFFGSKDAEIGIEVEYNHEKLNQVMTTLECMKPENQIQPVAAQPVFTGEEFTIQDETYGAQIVPEQLSKVLHDYVGQFKSTLDLEEEKCYVMPKFTKDSPEVKAAADTMNQYTKASVTYSVEPVVTVEKSLISQWITVDEDMNVVFSTDAVAAYIDELCENYNTVGKIRTITTPNGKTAEVSGGSYGWKINRDAEYETLVENIKSGEVVTREPVYAQKAAAHGAADWGNTYLEVDLSAQHMWYISNGGVALETDVVTGVPIPERMTPPGTYMILEMMRNKTLRGDRRPDGSYEYETPVDYWMRVTWTGIGFHDAKWQPAFGGELYRNGRGSHGCINMPVGMAAQLYEMLSVGTPVVVHY